MNLSKLQWSSWIIILNITLLTVLIVKIYFTKSIDNFINYPQQVNPMAPIKSNQAVNTANNNYASLLLFLQQNPSKSGKFISDIKNKFFNNNCNVKDNIDFENLSKMSNGMPF